MMDPAPSDRPYPGDASDPKAATGTVTVPPSASTARGRHATEESPDALYASLVESLPIFVVRKDVQGRITYVNQGLADLLGKSPDQLIGLTDFDLFPDALARKYRSDDACVMQTGELFIDVEENIAGGVKAYFEVRKTPVRNGSGRIVGTQAIFWDVTEKMNVEQALANERDLLQTVIDHLPDLIYVKDPQGRYVIVNQAVMELLGLSSLNQIQGHTNDEFLGPEQVSLEQADDRQVLTTGVPLIEREEQILDRDGNERWLLTSKIPFRDASGQIKGLVGIDRNITRLKRSEDELRAARDAAHAASQAKSDFLANVSHEIRTPMNAIIGMTDLLLDTSLTDIQREYLMMVQQSGESLLSLINDILDYSKIEAGKLELDYDIFELREGIGDTMKSLALRAHGKGLELAFHIDPDVPDTLQGDLGRLRQIVINLVGNAIKFTEHGEVVLEVSSLPVHGTDVTLTFRVTDTGIGISTEQQSRIFEQFEQADTSITRRFGGTGLGLAICSRLVTLMNGTIDVASTPGKGSTFTFCVQLQIAADRPDRIPAASRLAVSDADVLVVDDNATNRRILNEMLSNWGMRPQLAADAHEAIELLIRANADGQPIPLVVSDINMPGVDGFSLVERIYDLPRIPRPAIILLTSGVRIEDSSRWRRLGVAAHLMKPIKQSELFESIVAALNLVVPDRPAELLARNRSTISLPRLHILLAEDNIVNQKLALAALDGLGHEIQVANNGRQAIEYLDRDRFDVVLMDVQMPEMDGLSATKEIRRRERDGEREGRQLIVAMTAHAMKGDREICLEAGMDDYLSKPIRVQDLCQLLARHFGAQDDSAARGPSSNTPPGLVNWNAALQSVNGNERLLRDVIEAFVDDVPRLLQAAQVALQTGDAHGLRAAAHAIKGSMLFLEAKGPMEVAQDLETRATSESMDQLVIPVAALNEHVQRLLMELQARLTGAPSWQNF